MVSTYNALFAYLEFGKSVTTARCLKTTEKVSFSIASEASYVYILSGQKLIKNAKNGPPEACGQTVLPDMSLLIGGKFKNSNATF